MWDSSFEEGRAVVGVWRKGREPVGEAWFVEGAVRKGVPVILR